MDAMVSGLTPNMMNKPEDSDTAGLPGRDANADSVKTERPDDRYKDFRISFEGPMPAGEGKEEWLAYIDGMPGMVVTSFTKQEAFNEMIVSLAVKLAYDAGLGVPKIDVEREDATETDKEIQVGVLNKTWGLNGYIAADPGHPVYETRDRYVIYLENEKLPRLRIPFYKEHLKPAIDFKR